MNVYVAEIAGRAVMVFNADDAKDAVGFVEAMQEDFLAVTSDGRPLWDGRAKVSIRRAEPPEVATHREAYNQAEADGAVEPGDSIYAWLVEVVDPDEDDE